MPRFIWAYILGCPWLYECNRTRFSREGHYSTKLDHTNSNSARLGSKFNAMPARCTNHPHKFIARTPNQTTSHWIHWNCLGLKIGRFIDLFQPWWWLTQMLCTGRKLPFQGISYQVFSSLGFGSKTLNEALQRRETWTKMPHPFTFTLAFCCVHLLCNNLLCCANYPHSKGGYGNSDISQAVRAVEQCCCPKSREGLSYSNRIISAWGAHKLLILQDSRLQNETEGGCAHASFPCSLNDDEGKCSGSNHETPRAVPPDNAQCGNSESGERVVQGCGLDRKRKAKQIQWLPWKPFLHKAECSTRTIAPKLGRGSNYH